jgi:hypothetical protein
MVASGTRGCIVNVTSGNQAVLVPNLPRGNRVPSACQSSI